jgi:hypothetical protein
MTLNLNRRVPADQGPEGTLRAEVANDRRAGDHRGEWRRARRSGAVVNQNPRECGWTPANSGRAHLSAPQARRRAATDPFTSSPRRGAGLCSRARSRTLRPARIPIPELTLPGAPDDATRWRPRPHCAPLRRNCYIGPYPGRRMAGGMGEVGSEQRELMRRWVAIKLVKVSGHRHFVVLEPSARRSRSWARRSRAHRRRRHRDRRPYLVMEFIEAIDHPSRRVPVGDARAARASAQV